MLDILSYLIEFGAVNGGFAFTVLMVSAFYYIFFILPRLKKVQELEDLNKKLQEHLSSISKINNSLEALSEIPDACDSSQQHLLQEIVFIKNELVKIEHTLDKILFLLQNKEK